MDSVDVRARIARKCDDIKELLLEKNAAYGNSALDPLRIFSRANPVEQIKVRLDDKLSRIARGSETSIKEDTPRDLCGYLILLMVAQDVETERVATIISEAGAGNACNETDCGDDCGECPRSGYGPPESSGGILVPTALVPAMEEMLASNKIIKGKAIPLDDLFKHPESIPTPEMPAVEAPSLSSADYEALANRAAALEQKVNPYVSNDPITCTVCNYTAGMTRKRCPNCNAAYPVVQTADPAAPVCFKCMRYPVTNPTNGLCSECARDEHVGCVVCGKQVPKGVKLCAACDPHSEGPAVVEVAI